jgi:hypothetical protein
MQSVVGWQPESHYQVSGVTDTRVKNTHSSPTYQVSGVTDTSVKNTHTLITYLLQPCGPSPPPAQRHAAHQGTGRMNMVRSHRWDLIIRAAISSNRSTQPTTGLARTTAAAWWFGLLQTSLRSISANQPTEKEDHVVTIVVTVVGFVPSGGPRVTVIDAAMLAADW